MQDLHAGCVLSEIRTNTYSGMNASMIDKAIRLRSNCPVPVILFLVFFISSCTFFSDEKPDESRFVVEVLVENLDEPLAMTFLPGDQVLFVERKGGLKLYDPVSDSVKTITNLPVNHSVSVGGYTKPVEEGLMGVIADPGYSKNHFIYLYHADTLYPRHLLTRWEFDGQQLVAGSMKVVLEVPIEREIFKCSGGSMAFDRQGNLFLAVGTNTHYIPTDTLHTPGGEVIVNTNEPESAGNTNDLRGKILRIHPNADGGYSIPEGNLFPLGDAKTRPEIYVMGTRNPWRISIDSKTGHLFWADPGRDDDKDDVARNNGKGMDEFNVAVAPGNYGWPFFVGDNKPYYAPVAVTGKKVMPVSIDSIFNTSVRNTGRAHLPPAIGSTIQYKYSVSDRFPLLGGGGRSSVGGPVFRTADFSSSERVFPSYYDGKWFVTDFIRGWIMLVETDERGNYVSMEPFLPSQQFSSVLDIQFSPSGDLYLLLYGSSWYEQNSNAKLVRIRYQGGNRKPEAHIASDRYYGKAPIQVQLSGKDSKDPDGDALTYSWEIRGEGYSVERKGADIPLVLDKAGVYKVRLSVTDKSGASSFDEIELAVGNDPPKVGIQILDGNETFYFEGDTIRYAINVEDAEDGKSSEGSMDESVIQRSIAYFPKGYKELEDATFYNKELRADLLTPGRLLIDRSDCRSCHMPDRPSVGPSYFDISLRYRDKPGALTYLAGKIIQGGSGVWGEQAMSAHPNLTKAEAELIASHILSLGSLPGKEKLPLEGAYPLADELTNNEAGCILLQASYKDKGTSQAKPISVAARKILRPSLLDPEEADVQKGVRKVTTPSREILLEGDRAVLGFHSLDLTGIKAIQLILYAEKWKDMAGGYVECRIDGEKGALLGVTGPVSVLEDRKADKPLISLEGKALKGKHSVYFIFRNPGVRDQRLLMEIRGILFQK
jgi:cytochrome c